MANRPPSRGTSGRSSGGSTGMVSRIIHSGRLPLCWKASTTLRRLATFLRLASLAASFISARSWAESFFEVDGGQQLPNRFGAHVGGELAGELLHRLAVFVLAQDLTAHQRGVPLVEHDVGLEVENLLEFLEGHVEQGTRCATVAT